MGKVASVNILIVKKTGLLVQISIKWTNATFNLAYGIYGISGQNAAGLVTMEHSKPIQAIYLVN